MIYIGCPANCFTGGPELLHQLAVAIKNMGFECKMCYFISKSLLVDWTVKGTQYEKYQVDTETSLQEVDQKDNWLIVPETSIKLGYQCSNCHIIIYWMSVDNYYSGLNAEDDKLYRKYFQETVGLHIVQSQYAYDFCAGNLQIDKEKIIFVSDYINENYMDQIPQKVRKDYICFNPKKGFAVVAKLMYYYPTYCWIPLVDLSVDEMIDRLSVSKIYIDFGKHPGKDRIPREAAVCGCCVLTNRRGSAANEIDVSIPEWYKIEDENDFCGIINIIDDILERYEDRRMDFEEYVTKIKGEKAVFLKQVKEMIEYIQNME